MKLTTADIQNRLDLMFEGNIRPAVSDQDFVRVKRRGIVIVRERDEAMQRIEVHFAVPKRSSADALISPVVVIAIPRVNAMALELVDGDPLLLANEPKLTISEPLGLLGPLHRAEEFEPRTAQDWERLGPQLASQVVGWGLPFLDKYTTPAAIASVFESQDPRFLRDSTTVLSIAASLVVENRSRDALNLVESRFTSERDRHRFASVFCKLSKSLAR